MMRNEWAGCATLLGAAYPKERMDEGQMALYWLCLSSFPAEAVQQAVLEHIHACKWFPTISEIRDRLVISDAPTAEAAWGMVDRARRSGGEYDRDLLDYRPYRFPDGPIRHTLEHLGWLGAGWQDFCRSSHVEADRAHFIQWYTQTIRQQRHHRDRTDAEAINGQVLAVIQPVMDRQGRRAIHG